MDKHFSTKGGRDKHFTQDGDGTKILGRFEGRGGDQQRLGKKSKFVEFEISYLHQKRLNFIQKGQNESTSLYL